jgi:hypothetical protein
MTKMISPSSPWFQALEMQADINIATEQLS